MPSDLWEVPGVLKSAGCAGGSLSGLSPCAVQILAFALWVGHSVKKEASLRQAGWQHSLGRE